MGLSYRKPFCPCARREVEQRKTCHSFCDAKPKAVLHFTDEEIPVTVLDDMQEMQIQLVPFPPVNSAKQ
jgi:hypothetical protein